ncbi:MAG: nucleotidyl transferase AbiEii/AbiGii toxin family protein [Bacteriovoracaceae bacterium]|nr:nucleotidyl transferase AbiEii/AbiGii toxin family protein [Bacteriovoracaceae bacterium]
MHVLYGLQSQGYEFELKGGTSLSKGYRIIHRFSEDIDLKILPPHGITIPQRKNQTSKTQVKSRKDYFEELASEITIDGVTTSRANEFDNDKFFSAGINLHFNSVTEQISGVKPAVLLEVGFDDTTPNKPITISSWAFDKAFSLAPKDYIDNRAIEVKCYIPEFTFVEKLQAVVTKFRKYKETNTFEKNFIRHYYDLYCLLELQEIQSFIGTQDYIKRKKERFPKADDPLTLHTNNAFTQLNPSDFELFKKNYELTSSLYYKGQIPLEVVLKKIQDHLPKL